MHRVQTILMVLALAIPAIAAGSDVTDLGITLSPRRGLLSADKLVQAAGKIFTGTVPKKDFQKVCMPQQWQALATSLTSYGRQAVRNCLQRLTPWPCCAAERVRQWRRHQAAQRRPRG